MRIAVVVFLSFFVMSVGCTQVRMPPPHQHETSERPPVDKNYFAYSSDYGGWDFLTAYLLRDGVPKKLLRQVYGKDVVPSFDFVPFKLSPKENHDMYSGFRSQKTKALFESCFYKYQPLFESASKRFEVSPRLITAILVIESHCGQQTGDNLVVNRLSRVAAVGDPNNIRKNLAALRLTDDSADEQKVVARAQYLFNTFYPQLLALFKEHEKGKLDLFTLKGSIAGAFGWTQFLPQTYQQFAVDGDLDGTISLETPADAIFSVANFFHENGWKNELSRAKKHDVIWHYNRSIPYIDTVLYLMQES